MLSSSGLARSLSQCSPPGTQMIIHDTSRVFLPSKLTAPGAVGMETQSWVIYAGIPRVSSIQCCMVVTQNSAVLTQCMPGTLKQQMPRIPQRMHDTPAAKTLLLCRYLRLSTVRKPCGGGDESHARNVRVCAEKGFMGQGTGWCTSSVLETTDCSVPTVGHLAGRSRGRIKVRYVPPSWWSIDRRFIITAMTAGPSCFYACNEIRTSSPSCWR